MTARARGSSRRQRTGAEEKALLGQAVGEQMYFPGAPDLAVEIRSPRDRSAGVRVKVADYLEAGVRLVWVVDPKAERVTVYRSLLRPRILTREETLDGEDVLVGFSVAVSELFDV